MKFETTWFTRATLALALSSSTMLSAPSASAQPPAAAADATEIFVVLNSGASYRGEVIENVPGNHVTLRLATGEIKRFEAADIQSSRPVAPVAPAPRPQPVQEPPPAPPPPRPVSRRFAPAAPAGVYLHLDTDNPEAAVEARTGSATVLTYGAMDFSGDAFSQVCRAPCDTELDPSGVYRVAGAGITPSGTFTLDGKGDALKLRANTGSSTARGVGRYLLFPSIGVLAMGALLAGASSLGGVTNSGMQTAGLVLIGSGTALTGTSIFLWAYNSTSVSTSTGRTIGSLGSGPQHLPSGAVAGLSGSF